MNSLSRLAVWTVYAAFLLSFAACASRSASTNRTFADSGLVEDSLVNFPPEGPAWEPKKPIIPPRVALLAGLLPLRALGIDTFKTRFPEYDGRGVAIAILDNGVDPGVPGLVMTPGSESKLLDLRDFSGQGRITLERMQSPDGDTLEVAGYRLTGLDFVLERARAPFYVGVFSERQLGRSAAADVNGNRILDEGFPLVVARVRGVWSVFTDTDGDGSLAGETAYRDFLIGNETFSYKTSPDAFGPAPLTIAINLEDTGSEPVLDFYFDDSGHGTHVAGIAAGHDMFDVEGFDGVAPGARLLGLKIADNSRGGISVGGSVVRAMDYAVQLAEEYDMALVINMSHGIGNEAEGDASIDSIINEFVLRHPHVLFVVSAGNEGPGISSVGFPGSAEQALSVCALYPAVFVQQSGPGIARQPGIVAPWSARGGEVAKPDICAPGKAFSTVPYWNAGNEVLEGTSQAAPQVAGAAALLLSAVRARNLSVRAIDVLRALTNTASRPENATVIDVGAGIPNVSAALNWLLAGHQAGLYTVAALDREDGQERGKVAFLRDGFSSPSDTLQSFVVTSLAGQPAARLLLESDVDWIRTPDAVEPQGGPVTIEVSYDKSKLDEPGLYVGVVSARSATDTSAGPLFELVNAIVVPHGLSPRGYRQRLGRGLMHRHFFEVPGDAGGLQVTVGLPDPSSNASLYLFEPDGKPVNYFGEKVGGFRSSSISINVGANDLVPGVYEAVVLAPPASDASYSLEVTLPDIAVQSIRDGPTAEVRNLSNSAVRAIVSAELVGALTRRSVEGNGSTGETMNVTPPSWADRMRLRVKMSKNSWNRLTGFGVTVVDSLGERVSDGPLNYSGAQQVVELESVNSAGALSIELMPAFARAEALDPWIADLEILFLLPEPISLSLPDGSVRTGVLLGPSSTREVAFYMETGWLQSEDELSPLVEVIAQLPIGPPSFRRGIAFPLDGGH